MHAKLKINKMFLCSCLTFAFFARLTTRGHAMKVELQRVPKKSTLYSNYPIVITVLFFGTHCTFNFLGMPARLIFHVIEIGRSTRAVKATAMENGLKLHASLSFVTNYVPQKS